MFPNFFHPAITQVLVMNKEFRYLVDLATRYELLADDPARLYAALSELPESILDENLEWYGDTTKRFQPVNLLRAEILRRLKAGKTVDDETVEDIKERIRTKEVRSFRDLPEKYAQEFENYQIGKRDIFANWQKLWSIFHPILFGESERRTTQLFLERISKEAIRLLEIPDYTFHTVDFYGASNYGSEMCWVSLYPSKKESHRQAYQFHIRIKEDPEAGLMPGFDLEDPEPEAMARVETFDEVIEEFRKQKSRTLSLNESLRDYFKFAPGTKAYKWEQFKEESVIALKFQYLGVEDLNQYSTIGELNLAAGLEEDSGSNNTWNLWLFRNADKGDVVFASKGRNICLGVGVIDGEYEFHSEEEYQHRRKVKWITDLSITHEENESGKKSLFRPDSFSPTLQHDWILSKYVSEYPELKETFEDHNLEFHARPSPEAGEIIEPEPDVTERETHYWWLNANPSIWSISDFGEGERQTYTARNERGNKRRIFKYFEEAAPNDLVVGYESSPSKQIKGIFEVTKGLHETERQGQVVEFELVEKLDIPVYWNELQNNPSLEGCEPLINNQGSLFKLEPEEFEIIRDLIDEKNIPVIEPKVAPYDYLKDPDKPFLSEPDFRQIVDLLSRKKNVVLQGPPGVGKTFIAKKIAYEQMGEVNDAQIEVVQFHQSYSYEDFIQGIRPVRDRFELKNGTFYSFCQQAQLHPERDFFFVIDEINRGNLSKIFGELMMLIESDKRGRDFEIKLTYAEDEEDRFYVPKNVYLIGTMNTADRSLAIVDYALRRRFAFVNLAPAYNGAFRGFLKDQKISQPMIEHICRSVGNLNGQISADIDLGSGFQIGHSYFCSKRPEDDELKWFEEVLHFEIRPLLEEIWFDEPEKVAKALSGLRYSSGNSG